MVLGDKCRGSGEGVEKERRRGLGTGIDLEMELNGKGRIGATRVRGITGSTGGFTIVLGFGRGGMSFSIKSRVKIVVQKPF